MVRGLFHTVYVMVPSVAAAMLNFSFHVSIRPGTFFFNIMNFLPGQILRRTFDDVLVKPVKVLPYLMSSSFICNYAAHMTLSAIVMAVCLRALRIQISVGFLWKAAGILLAGSLIYGGLFLIVSGSAFLGKKVSAVSDISFTIESGELVGFIGENGAGKSSTIEMMSGILFPTDGSITVAGLCPYRKREENAKNIGVVFGQRSRLNWDLPMMDSFELYQEIYRIDPAVFRKNVERFVEMLHMQEFWHTPVRQLSLGQRMKAEVALSLLHEPPILYLDEPTIGLDVMAKQQIREFIRERNRLEGTTVILTSHDTKDLDCVCRRMIVLAGGHIVFDGSIERFKQDHAREGGG